MKKLLKRIEIEIKWFTDIDNTVIVLIPLIAITSDDEHSGIMIMWSVVGISIGISKKSND